MQRIELSEEERAEVEGFIRRGKANARNITRAHILLKSGEGWTIAPLAETFGVSEATVSNVRARYRAGRVLKDKVQKNRRRALARKRYWWHSRVVRYQTGTTTGRCGCFRPS